MELILGSTDASEPKNVVVTESPFLIGRASDSDLVLPHPEVSGRHAVLRSLHGGWSIRDLDSTNGTFLNGIRVTAETPIRPGDILHLGAVSYRVLKAVEKKMKAQNTVNAPETIATIRGVVEVYRILEQGRGRISFQPVVHMDDGEPIGWEALGRSVPPSDIPTALLLELAAMDRIAAKLSRAWLSRARECLECGHCWPGKGRPYIFVNLHPDEILSPDFPVVMEILAVAGLTDEYRFVLEFPEKLADRNREMEVWLREVRQRGMLVAFDDFAKGQSRIDDLLSTPPDFLKLDRVLMTGIEDSGPKKTLLRGVVDACREMGVSIIAEGIETEAQRGVALDLGIPLAQGFLFGHPEPAYKLFDYDPAMLPAACPFMVAAEANAKTAAIGG